MLRRNPKSRASTLLKMIVANQAEAVAAQEGRVAGLTEMQVGLGGRVWGPGLGDCQEWACCRCCNTGWWWFLLLQYCCC